MYDMYVVFTELWKSFNNKMYIDLYDKRLSLPYNDKNNIWCNFILELVKAESHKIGKWLCRIVIARCTRK